jgi:hypothetical protein
LSEINDLDDGEFNEDSRASYLKNQMQVGASSHREYFRKRTNSKWDASTQTAHSNHPCSPLSKWRKYTYIKQDRHHTIDSTYVDTTFEIVPSEMNFTTTIYQVDSYLACGECNLLDSSTSTTTGYSGSSFLDFGGYDDYITWSVNMDAGGMYPISFRFAQGSSSYNGNRKLDLYVNGVL